MGTDPLSPSSSSSSAADDSKKREAIAVALALDDIPPSYEFATTVSASTSADADSDDAGESSAHAAAAAAAGPSRLWPDSMDDLFSGPPNAEPTITKDRAAAGPKIEVLNRGTQRVTIDPRLQDRECIPLPCLAHCALRPASVLCACPRFPQLLCK